MQQQTIYELEHQLFQTLCHRYCMDPAKTTLRTMHKQPGAKMMVAGKIAPHVTPNYASKLTKVPELFEVDFEKLVHTMQYYGSELEFRYEAGASYPDMTIILCNLEIESSMPNLYLDDVGAIGKGLFVGGVYSI